MGLFWVISIFYLAIFSHSAKVSAQGIRLEICVEYEKNTQSNLNRCTRYTNSSLSYQELHKYEIERCSNYWYKCYPAELNKETFARVVASCKKNTCFLIVKPARVSTTETTVNFLGGNEPNSGNKPASELPIASAAPNTRLALENDRGYWTEAPAAAKTTTVTVIAPTRENTARKSALSRPQQADEDTQTNGPALPTTSTAAVEEETPSSAPPTPSAPELDNGFNYTVLYPSLIFPRSSFKVVIFTEPSQNLRTGRRLKVSASLETGYETQWTEVVGEGGVELTMDVGNLKDDSVSLKLKFRSNGVQVKEEVKSVKVSQKEILLVQTDKLTYKPEDRVQFRALILDELMRPIDGATLTVKILDSQKNLIKIWSNISPKRPGFFSGNLKLAREPSLGEWKIEVAREISSARVDATSGLKKTVHFNVAEYILPKFALQVEMPEFEIISDARARPTNITVVAKYTHGNHVKGDCTVEVKLIQHTCKKGWEEYTVHNSTVQIDGVVRVDINTPSIKKDTKNGAKLVFYVTVRESATGISTTEKRILTLFLYPYQVKPVEKISYHRHGLPFPIEFHIVDQRGALIESANDNVTVKHNFGPQPASNLLQNPKLENGILRLDPTESAGIELDERFIEVEYKGIKFRYVAPELIDSSKKRIIPAHSLSAELIHPINPNAIRSGAQLTLRIQATHALSSLNYVFVSNGKIHSVLPTESANLNNETKIGVPQDMGPQAALFVFTYIDGHYVGDSLPLKIESLSNSSPFQMDISKDKFSPGDNVTLRIRAPPNSIVALRGVDQSVLLLEKDQDITQSYLGDELNQTSSTERNPSSWISLESAGFTIGSNFAPQARSGDTIKRFYRDPLEEPCAVRRGEGGPGSQLEAARALERRTYFPETWLWQDFSGGDQNGNFNFTRIAPDSMTSWVITGYALNPQTGLNILPAPLKFTTIKPFFITLNLPYSIEKGEKLVLTVLLNNYHPNNESLNAKVTISPQPGEFEIRPLNYDSQRGISCPPNSVTPVEFTLRPLKHGNLKLDIQADAVIARDALLKLLRVTPGGVKKVTRKLKDMKATLPEKEAYAIRADLPSGARGGEDIKIQLIADVMGNVDIDNLAHLIKLPLGCGEQNMLTFSTNLAILDYLNGTNQLEEKVLKRAQELLEEGYQRELNYHRKDGSFSPFGNSDSNSSTWLTAMVIRNFLIATKYITIDQEIIKNGLSFLSAQMLDHGLFEEKGTVLDQTIQKSLGPNGIALTAFSLLTMVEARSNGIVQEKIDVCVRFLNDRAQPASVRSLDTYSLILLTHAMSEENPKNSNIQKFLPEIKARALKPDDTTMYWLHVNANNSTTPALAIEISAYALLIFTKLGEKTDALRVANWLVKKQNENGGFISTRDTTVALSALAKYSALTSNDVVNATVDIFALKTTGVLKIHRVAMHVPVTKLNSKLLQEFSPPGDFDAVYFQVGGVGTVRAYVTWTHYLDKEEQVNRGFSLSVVEPAPGAQDSSNLELEICARYLSGDKSNMAVLEVTLPSGFTVNSNGSYASTNQITLKRQEITIQGGKIEFYFDYILKSEQTCATVKATQMFTLENHGKVFVKVFDYYEPDTKFAEQFYP